MSNLRTLMGGNASPIKSVQRALTRLNTSTLSLTIQPVDMNKAVCNFLGSTLLESAGNYVYIRLTSPTTLFIDGVAGDDISWEIIEYV